MRAPALPSRDDVTAYHIYCHQSSKMCAYKLWPQLNGRASDFGQSPSEVLKIFLFEEKGPVNRTLPRHEIRESLMSYGNAWQSSTGKCP